MKYPLYIGIIIYIYLSTSVAAKIGIASVGSVSSFILILLFLGNIIADTQLKLIVKYKEEFIIIAITIIIILIKYASGDSKGIQPVVFFLLIPMFISVLIGIQNRYTKNNLLKIILFFLVTESLLAIYEK